MLSTTTAQTYIALDWSALAPLLALIGSAIGGFISKESDFEKSVNLLLEKFLGKKVAALRLLIDSIEFTARSFGETRDFKGKRYFTEVDKYSTLGIEITGLARSHRMIVSGFYYSTIAALVITAASLVKIGGLDDLVLAAAIGLMFFVIVGIARIRNIENRISTLLGMDELKHDE